MRIELAGVGDPIPTEALPDAGLDSTLPPQTFMLENGKPFLKHDYVGLGYTNFEVWCIGAVGGRGGGVHIYSRGDWLGGAGGGGGVQRAVGLLADLADETAVVVGQPGADGQDGNGAYAMQPQLDGSGYIQVHPVILLPNPNYVPPLAGQDGGYSLFGPDAAGQTICVASGGKGGGPSEADPYSVPDGTPVGGGQAAQDLIAWTDYVNAQVARRVGGRGGQGGVGGQIEAGGGALGGDVIRHRSSPFVQTVEWVNAKDGTWSNDLGLGGGGGLGGYVWIRSTEGDSIQLPQPSYPVALKRAGNGSKGAFSYADTSIYGPGQVASGGGQYAAHVAGTGGGARLNKVAGFGSRAPKFAPIGAVMIRLTKVS